MLKYVLDVVEPLDGIVDPETGDIALVGGYTRRFTFDNLDDAVIAFAKAVHQGFDAQYPRKVRDRKAVMS